MNKPWCCGEEATWIDIGDTLQYFFCKVCRHEVATPHDVKEVRKSYGDAFHLTQEEIDKIFDAVNDSKD